MVAISGVLTAGTYYTGLLPEMVNTFAYHLGLTTAQTKIIQEIGRPIGASVTSNGVTITVDAIIGDENMATVVYSFAYEDNTPFQWSVPSQSLEADEEGLIVRNDLTFQSYSRVNSGFFSELEIVGQGTIMDGTGTSSYQFVDLDPNDGTAQYIETLSFEKMPIGKKVTSVFFNLGYDEEIYKYENGLEIKQSLTFYPLIEGEWEVEYRFDYGNSSKILESNEVFIHQEREIYVNEILISPLSLNIDLEFEKIELDYNEFLQTFENEENITEDDGEKNGSST